MGKERVPYIYIYAFTVTLFVFFVVVVVVLEGGGTTSPHTACWQHHLFRVSLWPHAGRPEDLSLNALPMAQWLIVMAVRGPGLFERALFLAEDNHHCGGPLSCDCFDTHPQGNHKAASAKTYFRTPLPR